MWCHIVVLWVLFPFAIVVNKIAKTTTQQQNQCFFQRNFSKGWWFLYFRGRGRGYFWSPRGSIHWSLRTFHPKATQRLYITRTTVFYSLIHSNESAWGWWRAPEKRSWLMHTKLLHARLTELLMNHQNNKSIPVSPSMFIKPSDNCWGKNMSSDDIMS